VIRIKVGKGISISIEEMEWWMQEHQINGRNHTLSTGKKDCNVIINEMKKKKSTMKAFKFKFKLN